MQRVDSVSGKSRGSNTFLDTIINMVGAASAQGKEALKKALGDGILYQDFYNLSEDEKITEIKAYIDSMEGQGLTYED